MHCEPVDADSCWSDTGEEITKVTTNKFLYNRVSINDADFSM